MTGHRHHRPAALNDNTSTPYLQASPVKNNNKRIKINDTTSGERSNHNGIIYHDHQSVYSSPVKADSQPQKSQDNEVFWSEDNFTLMFQPRDKNGKTLFCSYHFFTCASLLIALLFVIPKLISCLDTFKTETSCLELRTADSDSITLQGMVQLMPCNFESIFISTKIRAPSSIEMVFFCLNPLSIFCTTALLFFIFASFEAYNTAPRQYHWLTLFKLTEASESYI